MQNKSESHVINRRTLAAWRTRACAAAFSVGTQVFLLGSGVAMPLCLNSAWLSSLVVLPTASIIVLSCCRAHTAAEKATCSPNRRRYRLSYILLALTLTANAVIALAALLSLAEQTLIPQTRIFWSASSALCASALCALSGGTGVSRLCFALRYFLPVVIVLLTAVSIPLELPAGLFPLLGTGTLPLAVSCACMLSAASPVLMLLLSPPELMQIEDMQACSPMPGAGFFLRRVLCGAGFGCFLLFMLCVCGTYESIAAQNTWGERLSILCSGQPHKGIPQTLLTVCQLCAAALLAVNMLCAAAQALTLAFPKRSHLHTGLLLLTLLCALCLLVLIIFGMDKVLFSVPWLILPSVFCLFLCRSGKEKGI